MSLWDKIKDTGKKILPFAGAAVGGPVGYNLGKALIGGGSSPLDGLLGGGTSDFSSAAQFAAASEASKYGYDKALEGIQQQNATAKEIANQANLFEQENTRRYNESTREIAQEANRVSSAEALKNREFQLYASTTAHQREVADLRAAGLNPILSGTGGMGASTPAGATGQAHQAPQSKPRVHTWSPKNEGAAISTAMDVLRTVTAAFASVASTSRTQAETQYIKEAKTPQTRAETAKTRSETLPHEDNIARLKAQVRNISADTHRTLMDADLKSQMREQSKVIVQNLEKTGKNLSVQNRQMLAQLKQMLADEQVYNGEAGYWIRLIEKLAPAAGKLPNPIRKGR